MPEVVESKVVTTKYYFSLEEIVDTLLDKLPERNLPYKLEYKYITDPYDSGLDNKELMGITFTQVTGE